MELIIDKNTKLNKIENKEDYTSIVIKTKVNPKKLNGFKNVKYLSIEYIDNNNYNYNEKHINQLPFKSNIEKISFKHIEKYGVLKRKRNEIIFNVLEYLPNLKCIEFPPCIKNVSSCYLKNINALEELIFNIEPTTNQYSTMYLYSDKLRRIIIKYFDKEYILDLDYEISAISETHYITENNSIFIKYSNEDKYNRISSIEPMKDFTVSFNAKKVYDDETTPSFGVILRGNAISEDEEMTENLLNGYVITFSALEMKESEDSNEYIFIRNYK